jgi:hypothetical protein
MSLGDKVNLKVVVLNKICNFAVAIVKRIESAIYSQMCHIAQLVGPCI